MPPAPLKRRTFLRSAGVCIGLPLLDAMFPVGLKAEQKAALLRGKRMVLIGRGLGLHAPYFFPEQAGKNYEPSRYLKPLQNFRGSFTVFSGMSHRGYPGGHGTGSALLTGVAPEAFRSAEVRNTISLDQEAASHLGGATRHPCLVLGSGAISWNREGVKVPSQPRATQVFKQLFINGSPQEMAREVQRIREGQSILDGVRDQARSLARIVGPSDRSRLDLLQTSIRDAEKLLQQEQAWVRTPKPKVREQPFTDDYAIKLFERERQWFHLVHLALQTDSTRVIALWLEAHAERLDLDGIVVTPHDASHHGQDEGKLRQLALIEETEMTLFAGLLQKLRGTNEGGLSLLDQTVVFHGSNLGNASAHTCQNLPILLAGGGFNHAGHVVFDRQDNMPLSNLFVRMLTQVGIEVDRFGSSTGTLSEV